MSGTMVTPKRPVASAAIMRGSVVFADLTRSSTSLPPPLAVILAASAAIGGSAGLAVAAGHQLGLVDADLELLQRRHGLAELEARRRASSHRPEPRRSGFFALASVRVPTWRRGRGGGGVELAALEVGLDRRRRPGRWPLRSAAIASTPDLRLVLGLRVGERLGDRVDHAFQQTPRAAAPAATSGAPRRSAGAIANWPWRDLDRLALPASALRRRRQRPGGALAVVLGQRLVGLVDLRPCRSSAARPPRPRTVPRPRRPGRRAASAAPPSSPPTSAGFAAAASAPAALPAPSARTSSPPPGRRAPAPPRSTPPPSRGPGRPRSPRRPPPCPPARAACAPLRVPARRAPRPGACRAPPARRRRAASASCRPRRPRRRPGSGRSAC